MKLPYWEYNRKGGKRKLKKMKKELLMISRKEVHMREIKEMKRIGKERHMFNL